MNFAVRKPRVVEEDQLLAAAWYDAQQPGLGDEFLDEVDSVVAALPANPLLYSVRFGDVRCVRLKRRWRLSVLNGSQVGTAWPRNPQAGVPC